MASFNKVILLGNLTRDPELRVTPEGFSICKLGLASTRVFYTKDGTKKEETVFVDVDAFGKPAETIAKYMNKGRPILIEGRLKYDQWETTSGEKRSKLCVVLENFQFIGTGRGESGGSAEAAPAEAASGLEEHTPPPREAKTAPAAPKAAPASKPRDEAVDDVPF